jgi:hypothetical protein
MMSQLKSFGKRPILWGQSYGRPIFFTPPGLHGDLEMLDFTRGGNNHYPGRDFNRERIERNRVLNILPLIFTMAWVGGTSFGQTFTQVNTVLQPHTPFCPSTAFRISSALLSRGSSKNLYALASIAGPTNCLSRSKAGQDAKQIPQRMQLM